MRILCHSAYPLDYLLTSYLATQFSSGLSTYFIFSYAISPRIIYAQKVSSGMPDFAYLWYPTGNFLSMDNFGLQKTGKMPHFASNFYPTAKFSSIDTATPQYPRRKFLPINNFT